MYNTMENVLSGSKDEIHPVRTTASSSSTAAAVAGPTTATNMTPLPLDFQPGPDDVICGRGKKCYNHIGNERFRVRVTTYLEEYSAAKTKLEKSAVLCKVVDAVRQQSPNGGFVKQDEKGLWHEVGDFLAREKTSQSFRDALHDRYKSSNVSKKKRRQDEHLKHAAATSSSMASRAAAAEAIRMMGQPRPSYETSRLDRLSNELLTPQDLHEMEYFNRRNSDMSYNPVPLQQQTQTTMRLSPLLVDPTRRYLTGNPRDARMMASRERPLMHETARLPDPLFGPARVNRNATPSDFDRSGLLSSTSYQQRDFEMNRSMNLSEPDFNRSDHLPFTTMDARSFHLSHLEMGGYQNVFDDYSLHQQSSLHRSFPDVLLQKSQGSSGDSGDRKRAAKEMDPVPYEQTGSMPRRTARKSIGPEPFMKKMNPSPTAAASPRATAAGGAPIPTSTQFPLQSSHHQQSHPMYTTIGGQRISRELMECLDKMTYHSIADDNPFEPIPLAPQQEAALLVQRRLSDVTYAVAAPRGQQHQQQQQSQSQQSQSQQQHPIIDDSERDEFAEG